MVDTFWNYQPAKARKVKVIVGEAPKKTWWCYGLEGTIREAVEIKQGHQTFYLDNEAFWPSEERIEELEKIYEEEGHSISFLDLAIKGHPAGTGWDKVTKGQGGPQYGHSSLPVKEVIGPV